MFVFLIKVLITVLWKRLVLLLELLRKCSNRWLQAFFIQEEGVQEKTGYEEILRQIIICKLTWRRSAIPLG